MPSKSPRTAIWPKAAKSTGGGIAECRNEVGGSLRLVKDRGTRGGVATTAAAASEGEGVEKRNVARRTMREAWRMGERRWWGVIGWVCVDGVSLVGDGSVVEVELLLERVPVSGTEVLGVLIRGCALFFEMSRQRMKRWVCARCASLSVLPPCPRGGARRLGRCMLAREVGKVYVGKGSGSVVARRLWDATSLQKKRGESVSGTPKK